MVQENLFNRRLLYQNWQRIAKGFNNYNFLYKEVANRINEKITDCALISDKSFTPSFSAALNIERDHFIVNGSIIRADDEFLPFKNESFDLITSNLNFHFINQIPQFLLQVRNILKPNGLFIASFFGEENLTELRRVLYEVESEIYGAISPRISPTIGVKTAGSLLQKAGFVNPISNLEKILVEYADPINLLKDLKMMGQANIMEKRSRKFVTKKFLEEISKKYKEFYKTNENKVLATFEIVTIIGTKAGND